MRSNLSTVFNDIIYSNYIMLKSRSRKESSAVYGADTNQRDNGFFSPSYPANCKKVIRQLLCVDSNLFHIVINPPPFLNVHEDVIYEECTLLEQWEFVKNLLQSSSPRFARLTEAMIIVPERTKKGLLHLHLVVDLKPYVIDTDLKPIIYDIFNIRLPKLKPSERKSVTSFMIHFKPIKDEGIIDYLFNKDTKDYETLLHFKDINNNYKFTPLVSASVRSLCTLPDNYEVHLD